MADISFWGGIGHVGSSKVLIEQDGWRVLLDLGLDYGPNSRLFSADVHPRLGRQLHDRIATQTAPPIPYLYRFGSVEGLDVPQGSDHQTAVCISHAHPDHMELTGWVDPDIPIFCAPETQRIRAALEAAGRRFEGGSPALSVVGDGETVHFGPFHITRYPVDHDIPGASGYSIATDDGLVAYSGDIRLHGRHPEQSLSFAQSVRHARALIIEGSSLGSDFAAVEPTELEVDRRFRRVLRETPGLVYMAADIYNVERMAAFCANASAAGRTIIWPAWQFSFLTALGVECGRAWHDDLVAAISRHPTHYVVQLQPAELPLMLDLPHGPGSVFLHANGDPMGEFDPNWRVLKAWLDYTRTPFLAIGTSGHATPDDLNILMEIVAPDIVFPLHSPAPDRLMPPPGTARWLPQKGGRRYRLGGR